MSILVIARKLRKLAFGARDLEKLYNKAKSFGVITAYRSNLSKSENKYRMRELLMILQKAGLRSFEDQKSEWEGIKEKSIIIPNISFELLLTLAKKYDQDAFIYKDPSGSIGIYYPSGKAEMAYAGKESPISVSTDPKKEYSKGRSFSFSLKLIDHPFEHNGSPITLNDIKRALAA